MPTSWSANDLVGTIEEPRVVKVSLIKNSDASPSGKAILHYRSSNDAESSLENIKKIKTVGEAMTFELYEDEVSMNFYKKGQNTDKSFKKRLGNRIYIKNLAPGMTKDDIYALTKELSDIKEIKFPLHPDGSNKGFSLVYLSSKDHVANVINFLHNKEIFGSKIEVTSGLAPQAINDSTRLEEKLDYIKYIKRKYNATMKQVDLKHVPSLESTINKLVEAQTNSYEKKKIYEELMSEQDQRLEDFTRVLSSTYRMISQ